jgi:hypothetical protein
VLRPNISTIYSLNLKVASMLKLKKIIKCLGVYPFSMGWLIGVILVAHETRCSTNGAALRQLVQYR